MNYQMMELELYDWFIKLFDIYIYLISLGYENCLIYQRYPVKIYYHTPLGVLTKLMPKIGSFHFW